MHSLAPIGHKATGILRCVPGERVVLRTKSARGDFALLVLTTAVPLRFSETVRSAVLSGHGSIEGLPAEVSRTLEGFRARATVDGAPGIALVADAGIVEPGRDAEFAGPLPPSGCGYVWVASCWVAGETLDRCWAGLHEQQRLDLLVSVADRLVTLHRRRVLYGDLKPANVVVTEHGAVLIDLETMRVVPDQNSPVRCLEYTPGFAAPEQIEHNESRLRSDVYAFGMLAAAQLTGLQPEAARDAVRSGTAIGIPETWAAVLDATLAEDPTDRPTASELSQLLTGHLDIEPHPTVRVNDPALQPQPQQTQAPSIQSPAASALPRGLQRRIGLSARRPEPVPQRGGGTPFALYRVPRPDSAPQAPTPGQTDRRQTNSVRRRSDGFAGPRQPPVDVTSLYGALGSQDRVSARRVFEGALADQARMLGPEHPDTLRTKQQLAASLHDWGELEDAVVLLQSVIEVQRRKLGPEHPSTRAIEDELAVWLQATRSRA